MSKRLFWLLSLLVAVAMMLAACGGAQPAAPTEAPAAEEPAAEAPAATEEPAAEAPAATEEPAAEAPATEEPAAEAPAATEEPAAEAPAAEGCTDAIGCVEIAAGDPIHIAFGQSQVFDRVATVTRAGPLLRGWTRLKSYLDLGELYEVSFSHGRLK